MLKKKENGLAGGGSQALNTIIGRGTSFEGRVEVENSVRIDGVFKGELNCSGALTISQTGEVHAKIGGKEIYVNGVVHGTLRAEKVHLDSQARFIGDIFSSSLSISEGAVFHGNCSMEAGEEESQPLSISPSVAKSQSGAALGSADGDSQAAER